MRLADAQVGETIAVRGVENRMTRSALCAS